MVCTPTEVSESVYNRMRTERQRLARALRAQGNEVAAEIRARADKSKTVILADAYREAEETKGDGDAVATSTYAAAYTRDPEFYDFTRSLKAYQATFQNNGHWSHRTPGTQWRPRRDCQFATYATQNRRHQVGLRFAWLQSPRAGSRIFGRGLYI